MKDLYKKIYDLLPHKWEMVTLNMYNRLLEIVPATSDIKEIRDVDNNLKYIAALSGVEISVIETLPRKYTLILIDKIKFAEEPVKVNEKTTLKFKSVDDLTYDEYVTVSQIFEQPTPFYHPVLKAILVDKSIDVGELNIVDVMSGFFLQQRLYNKLLKRSVVSSQLRVIWMRLKEKPKDFYNRIRNK